MQLNVSGATDRINYSISGGVYRQEGIVYGSSYNRYSLRANFEAKVTDHFKVNLQLAPTFGLKKGIKVEGKDQGISRVLSLPGWVPAGAGRMAGAEPTKFYGNWDQA